MEPFATVEQYTEITGLSSARAEWDLDGASAEIRRQCGWHIWPVVTETLVVNGTGAQTLHLPTGKLLDVTACTELGRGSAGPAVELDTTVLEWSAAGWLWKAWPWTSRLRGVTVTIEHGYASVPDLAKLCLDLAERVSAGPTGIVRESAGVRSVEYARALTEDDRRVLDLYRVTV